MVKQSRTIAFPAVIALALLLMSCGGGGGAGSTASATNGSVSPLTVVKKVSVVDAQTTAAAEPAGVTALRFAVPAPLAVPDDPDSDYVNDIPNVYVEERSVESFNIVNQILCMVAQTGYGAMVNQGPYKAQVDVKTCEGRDSASAGGQQTADQASAANQPQYAMWTVDSSRADDSSPHIVKAWVHEPAQENMNPEQLIYARVTIDEAVSADNPLGIFTLDFEGHAATDGVPDPEVAFRGVLETERDADSGRVFLKFFQADQRSEPGVGDVSTTDQVLLDRDGDGSTGRGTLYNEQSISAGGVLAEGVAGGTHTSTFDIAYNDNNFLRYDGTTSACLDRKDFNASAWGYGLYDETGARVERNSGFPVQLTRGGQVYQGWVGYWGPWFPNDVVLQDGETVERQTYGSGDDPETYVAMVRAGMLRKHTRKLLTLGDVKNVPLEYHQFDETSGTDNAYRVLWNGTNFQKVARMDQAANTWRNITPVVLDLGALRYSELFFWSQSLGGSAQVKLDNCAPDTRGTPDPSDDTFACSADDATPVVSYVEVAVGPSDTVPATLACFEQCPDAGLVAAADPNPFATDIPGYQDVAPDSGVVVYKTYTFDDMTLKDGADNVVATDSSYQYGVMSGPLFEPTAANLDLLRCEFNDNATCGWQGGSSLPVYYTWQTGPNSYNRLTTLQNESDGTFVSFDPPLQLEYVHNGDGYTNARFSLEYNGYGNLNGIPGKCVDMDTGLDTDCSEGGPGSLIRWVPEFTIPDGSVATAGATSYYVKATDVEQRMKKVDGAVCTDAGLTTSSYLSDLPTADDYTPPDIGAEPEVTGPPAVVAGVAQ